MAGAGCVPSVRKGDHSARVKFLSALAKNDFELEVLAQPSNLHDKHKNLIMALWDVVTKLQETNCQTRFEFNSNGLNAIWICFNKVIIANPKLYSCQMKIALEYIIKRYNCIVRLDEGHNLVLDRRGNIIEVVETLDDV